MADLVSAVMAALEADPDVAAITSGRVFGGEVPASEVEHMARAAIVVRPAGGLAVFGGGYLPYSDSRIDLDCYGSHPRAAYLVAQAATARMRTLRREVHGGLLLHWATDAGGRGQDRDPGTRWPVFSTTWQLLADSRQLS